MVSAQKLDEINAENEYNAVKAKAESLGISISGLGYDKNAGLADQLRGYTAQIQVRIDEFLKPQEQVTTTVKDSNILPNSLNQIGQEITKPSIIPILLIGGLIVGAILLKN